MEYHLTLSSLEETQKLGQRIAQILEPKDVVTLRGELGSGKTELARSVIRYLMKNDSEVVPSPTFTLVQTYETSKGSLWHLDLYRLRSSDEVYELGIEEALAQSITLIEWPERLGDWTFQNALEVQIVLTPSSSLREVTLKGTERWAPHFQDLKSVP